MSETITTTTDTIEILEITPIRMHELRFDGLMTAHRVKYNIGGFAAWVWPEGGTPDDGEWVIQRIYANRPWGDTKGGQAASSAADRVFRAELPGIITSAVADHTEMFWHADEERRRLDRSTLERQLKETRVNVDLLLVELHKLRSGQDYTPYPIPS